MLAYDMINQKNCQAFAKINFESRQTFAKKIKKREQIEKNTGG